MSLRARLVVVLVIVIAALVTSVTLVVGYQRDFLTGQIDDELRSAGRLVLVGTSNGFPAVPPRTPPTGTTIGPISDLFVGVLQANGELLVMTQGQLLTDVPQIDIDRLNALGVAATSTVAQPGLSIDPFTTGGVDSDEQFRVRATSLTDGSWAIVARPLGVTDAAIDRLLTTLVLGALLVVLALAMAMWWVVRLGLRPIAAMTRTVTAIAAGDRSQRVETAATTTETGKLGAAFNDMLDQRDAAEARLRQFIADASHELRTPLTSIRGYLDLSLDGGFADDQREDVMRRIRAESRRMHDLVEDLLLLASLDEGRPLRSDPVDLWSVALDAASDARATQPSRTIEVTGTGTTAFIVDGDDMRLRQVVAGLVQNAIDHTPTDTRITLSVVSVGEGVELTVADDGPGMGPDEAARVFDRFTRGDPSRSRRRGGAGLGLAIATSIVQAHGGRLTLDTALGEGCTFHVRLPRTR